MQALPAVHELLSSNRFDTTLEATSEIEGKVKCKGPTSIAGQVTGTIEAKGLLVIEQGAEVNADIIGDQIIVHGRVTGKLTANVGVHLTETADFNGELRAPLIEMEKGAKFDGQSFMSEMVREADPSKDKTVPSPVHKLQHDLEAFIG